MKARPMLMSAPMVRGLLDGCKTQTRRVVKGEALDWLNAGLGAEYVAMSENRLCPYGVPGDLLWVRETWACHFATNDQRPGEIDPAIWSVRYRADGDIRPAWPDGSVAKPEQFTKNRPSLFMPRWASRLTLEITEVRVERLQEISRDDAKAEGLEWVAPTYGIGGIAASWHGDPRLAYAALWDSINGPGSWDANPWVWALTFKVHKANVDTILGASA